MELGSAPCSNEVAAGLQVMLDAYCLVPIVKCLMIAFCMGSTPLVSHSAEKLMVAHTCLFHATKGQTGGASTASCPDMTSTTACGRLHGQLRIPGQSAAGTANFEWIEQLGQPGTGCLSPTWDPSCIITCIAHPGIIASAAGNIQPCLTFRNLLNVKQVRSMPGGSMHPNVLCGTM